MSENVWHAIVGKDDGRRVIVVFVRPTGEDDEPTTDDGSYEESTEGSQPSDSLDEPLSEGEPSQK